MRENIRSSTSSKALAARFPLPPLGEALDAARQSVERFCLLAGIEALAEMMEADATAICGARHRLRLPSYPTGRMDNPYGHYHRSLVLCTRRIPSVVHG